jgi:DNA polymerase elongation subunit (family B)
MNSKFVPFQESGALYTNVIRYGNFILYRGYDANGKRIHVKVYYTPHAWIPDKTSKHTEWKSLDNIPLKKINFANMSDCTQYFSVADLIFGQKKYVCSFIQEKFPNEITYNRNLINDVTIDIEVAYVDEFPNPDKALQEILAITVRSRKNDTVDSFGIKAYDPSLSIGKAYSYKNVKYHQYENEIHMLKAFLDWWSDVENTPDIITGWNSRAFDIPYLYNRLKRLLGEKETNRLSPWNRIEADRMVIKGQSLLLVNMLGITQLDYLDLFKKFTKLSYGDQESYKLNHIAEVVLGEKKLDYSEYANLDTLYEENFQKFLDYNIRDVELVDKLEEKLNLITLVLTLAYYAGINYQETLGTTAMWDSIIFRYLANKKIAIPQPTETQKTQYDGGFVKEPIVGAHRWVMSFDLNSLYPSIIMQYNMSPETLCNDVIPLNLNPTKILKEKKIDSALIPSDKCVTANGQFFSKKKLGVFPEIVNNIYERRSKIKKEMISFQKQLEAEISSFEKRKLEIEIAKREVDQLAAKTLINSLYGAMGNEYFRYFDLRIAEGITQTGQAIIQWAEHFINEFISKQIFSEKAVKDRVIIIDTDSIYINAEDIINKFQPQNPLNFLDEFSKKVLEPVLEKAFKEFNQITNAYEDRLVMKRETICDSAIVVAKKRYILNVLDNEGVRYKEPKIKMKGIEAVKSSTPEVCRKEFEKIFKLMLTLDREKTIAAIDQFKEKFKTYSPEQIAFPRGVSDIKKYFDEKTIYGKGTPIHVRGALLFNYYVKKYKLKEQKITSGDKIKFLFLKLPNPIHENIIGFLEYLPQKLNLYEYIDFNMQFEKAFLDPLNLIFKALKWNLEDKSTLEDFFN